MLTWPPPHVPLLPGHAPALRLFDARAGWVRTAGGPGDARLLVCTALPVGGAHLGDLTTAVAVDLMVRAWRDAHLEVTHVQVVDDAGEAVRARASEAGIDPDRLVHDEAARLALDLTTLGVLPPDHLVDVAELVPQAVVAVGRLLAVGAAHLGPDVTDGGEARDVLADRPGGVDAHPAARSGAPAGAHAGGDASGEAPGPVLWRGARPGEQALDGGPLGPGHPGTSLTCAAAVLEHLGGTCDVLVAGPDLVASLAPCESHLRVLTGQDRPVQSRVCVGCEAVSGDEVRGDPDPGEVAPEEAVRAEAVPAEAVFGESVPGEEAESASEAAGSPVRVGDLVAGGASPLAVRLHVLAHHYRTRWDHTAAGLEAAQERLRRWTSAVSGNGGPAPEAMLAEVRAALADDLDTPRALRAVDDWAERAATYGQPGGLSEADVVEGAPGLVARAVDALLGVRL